jgi:hypothetical protein
MVRRWYWKVYLAVMVVLTAAAIGVSLYYRKEAASYYGVADWASLPMYVVQLVGLFGFIYGRRIGSPLLWKLVFAATVLEQAWMVYETATDVGPLSFDDLPIIAAMAVIGAVIYLPLLVALFIYAFRSPALWAGRLSAHA